MFDYLRADIKAVKERDPAARSSFEIFLLYPSVCALFWHRIAHKLLKIKLKWEFTWFNFEINNQSDKC